MRMNTFITLMTVVTDEKHSHRLVVISVVWSMYNYLGLTIVIYGHCVFSFNEIKVMHECKYLVSWLYDTTSDIHYHMKSKRVISFSVYVKMLIEITDQILTKIRKNNIFYYSVGNRLVNTINAIPPT